MNTLQVLGNQILGVFIFLLLSRYLDKDSYGELNWALAVLTVATTILSLRLEQIVVRDVAAGKDAGALLTLFIFHTVTAALLFLGVLFVGHLLLPDFFGKHPWLWLLSFSQLLLFIGLPFRQLVTGKGAFGWLAALSSISNGIRCLGLLAVILFSRVMLSTVVILFTVSALAEWILGAFIVFGQLRVRLDRKQRFTEYSTLIKDSLPQVGMVFLNAGMARIDWILMGVFSSPAHTAEYSFAYRAYEFSPLPLLVLAPFLLNSFSRRFVNGVFSRPAWLNNYVRGALVAGTLLPLLGVLIWRPAIDWLTLNKYGQSGASSFLILSCSIPFQYLINIHWTAEFASNRLKRIFINTAITAGVVLVGDIILIPRYAGEGAATAWLVAMAVQYFLYAQGPMSLFADTRQWNINLFLAAGIALLVGGLVFWLLPPGLPLRLVVAIAAYGGLAWLTGLVSVRDIPAAWMHRLRSIDWPLLLFLVGVLNVKLYVKIAAILLALILFRRTGIPGDVFRKKYLWFYVAMIGLAFLNFLFSLSSFSSSAVIAFCLGSGYWLLALLSAWCIYLFVQRGEMERLHRTVGVFFLLNSVCILISFWSICFESGSINPYTFEGMHRHYFINTGDMITGISLDGSVPTSLISAFGLLYFLYRNKYLASLFCMITVLLSGSNFIDIMLMLVFVVIFIFHTNRVQKSMIVVSLLLMVVFWAKVSPQNGEYVGEIIKRVDKKNVYIEPVPIPNAKNYEFVEKKEVVQKEVAMKTFEQTLYPRNIEDSFKRTFRSFNRSGRIIAWQQMAEFFGHHPELLPLGAGMGHFSSRLAFKTAALGVDGGYPAGKRFIHPFFRDNYLYLYVYYHSRDEGQHSVVNKPDGVYGQLLGEYGVAGLLLFGFLYVAFFCKRSRSLSFGLPILLLMGMAFFTEYCFEQLSIVILFELLLLLDQRANLNTAES